MTAASVRGPAHSSQARGAFHRARLERRPGRAKDTVITVLGVIGIVSVLWLAAAWMLNLSVIVFVTGSMSPTMPVGAAAIVQETPASELAPGDVVTVPKPNSGIPVTHRIVESAPVAGDPDARELTLKGDANDGVDPITYTVRDAQRVLIPIPALGWVVLAVKSPPVMVGLTLAIAGAIAWALWPSPPPRRPRHAPTPQSTDA